MSLCSICLPDENRDVTALHLQFCLFTYCPLPFALFTHRHFHLWPGGFHFGTGLVFVFLEIFDKLSR